MATIDWENATPEQVQKRLAVALRLQGELVDRIDLDLENEVVKERQRREARNAD